MEIDKYKDKRGELLFPIKNNNYFGNIVESTVSINKKNVFRGLHSNNFDKLVTCVRGKILDIIINLDETNEDYLVPKYYELSSEKNNQILVPKKHAHGFLVLEDDSIIIYYFNGKYSTETTKFINYQDPFLNIKLPINNAIISDKDNESNFLKPIDYILLGGTGYIGSHIYKNLVKQKKNIIKLNERLENIEKIREKLILYNPKYVINSAGISGYPNIDWCEKNKKETIKTNITYQLTLVDICNKLDIKLIIIGSGGIFKGNEIKKEEDRGDYFDTFYSECRIYLENIIRNYSNVLYLRINYPISSDNNSKNLLVKIEKWNQIADSDLSITCLDTMIPFLADLIESGENGVLNFVNPGYINLINIKKKINHIKKCDHNFTIFKNNRPCPLLCTKKMEKYEIDNIEKSIIECIKKLNNIN